MKRVVSLLLSVVLTCGLFMGFHFSSFAVSGNEIVSYARQFIGYPYVKNTHGPNAFDCSGFVHYVFKHFGIDLPISSAEYWNNPTKYGIIVGTGSTVNAVAGDVISWSGHVAIYTENGMCVEALNPRRGVCETFRVNDHTNGLNYKVIRIYGVQGGDSPDSAPQVSTQKKLYAIGENVTFSFSATGASSLHLYLYLDGNKYFEGEFNPNETYTRSLTTVGHYAFYIIAHYSNGDMESAWNDFDVAQDYSEYVPLKPDLWTEKTEYPANSNITIHHWSENASMYSVTIYKNSQVVTNQQLYTSICEVNISEPGEYKVVAQAVNEFGGSDYAECFFSIYNNAPEKPGITISKSLYTLGEIIQITLSPSAFSKDAFFTIRQADTHEPVVGPGVQVGVNCLSYEYQCENIGEYDIEYATTNEYGSSIVATVSFVVETTSSSDDEVEVRYTKETSTTIEVPRTTKTPTITEAPTTTEPSTTEAPTTEPPTTEPPTTEPSTTEPTTTEASTTEAPTTEPPATDAPTTEPPKTKPPVTTHAAHFTLGDVNMDGKINSSDARLALRAAAKTEKLSELQTRLADVSEDGKVKAADARTILRIAAKLEPRPTKTIA